MAISRITKEPGSAFSAANRLHYGVGKRSGEIVFLFPGQGSQYPYMSSELACEFQDARGIWDEIAAMTLDAEVRLDQVVFPIPVFTKEEKSKQQARLTEAHWAQPAIGATSASMLKILEALKIEPTAVAGHSYGEVTALYAAGSLESLEDFVAVSRRRGELMTQASASASGSMTAVRSSAAELESFLETAGARVTIANINSPNQVVLAGHTEEIEKAETKLKAASISFKRLPVATAFHTELVSGSATPFEEYLGNLTIREPNIPVYANTTATTYPESVKESRQTLATQLANPVRFQEILEKMYQDGARVFIEVGPGSVLAGMVKDTLKDNPHTVVSMDSRNQDTRLSLWNTFGTLAAAGIDQDFDGGVSGFEVAKSIGDKARLSAIAVQIDGSN